MSSSPFFLLPLRRMMLAGVVLFRPRGLAGGGEGEGEEGREEDEGAFVRRVETIFLFL